MTRNTQLLQTFLKKEEWLEAGKPIIRIQNLNNPEASFNYADDSHEQKYLVRNGDLLVSWSASLGVYYWTGQDAWLNQHIFRVHSLRGCDKGFLKYALQISIDDFYAKAHGMGMVHITKGNFESHQIELPPLAEQTRIAQKLDELLAQADTLKSRIDAIPALLKRFRQSVLAAAVSGRLTEEWRMQSTTLLERTDFEPFPKIFELYAEDYIEPPTHWQLNALGNMASFQQGLQIAKSERRTEPGPDVLPILRTVNYESNFKEDVHYVIVSDKSIIAKPEDIILSRTGTVGRVLTGYKGVMHNNSFRINYKSETFIREYLIIFLESPLCQGYIKKKAGKSSQPDLGKV